MKNEKDTQIFTQGTSVQNFSQIRPFLKFPGCQQVLRTHTQTHTQTFSDSSSNEVENRYTIRKTFRNLQFSESEWTAQEQNVP